MDEIADPGRDFLDPVDDLEDELRGTRVALGGLQDEPVPAGKRERQEPQRDHGREVERRDRRHDAHGLPDELDVHPRRDPFEVLALQQVRDRAGRLDRLDPAHDLAAGVFERLAHVLGDEAGELLPPCRQRASERHDRPRAALRRERTPRGLGRASRAHGGVDLGGTAQRHERGDLAADRIAVLEGLADGGRFPAAADVVAEGARLALGRGRASL